MIENLLVTPTMRVMEKGLDAAALRNTVISNNLANVDTPGYKRSEVVFEQMLRDALTERGRIKGYMTNEKHIPLGGSKAAEVKPGIVTNRDKSMRNDGNNVDIDREMAAMAKNSIMFNAISQLVSGEIQKLKMAISEGRR